ncbi:saccharopine dehydrogenase family protein [Pseudomonas sp. OV226]|uniref:saccharopine dehydrogenase family protein n=1 Tax=Pseudomonas sp. OV226 TaxID=2135588 RepID=UPI000D6BE320|nr:saccharopine dehydrogenase NADP-binding domain-containing protein [Pseudomonas sp. OV226]PWK28759.1 saccharopine dehydrogenase-like NADP-dependent oxidoreductase [Pseudomonas sp. OV226]
MKSPPAGTEPQSRTEELTHRASHVILVLGGYGFFGERICGVLARNERVHLIIGGRDGVRARKAVRALGLPSTQGVAIDASDPALAERLAGLGVRTVIHTAGPFQGQDYAVARAAITAGANYIDLADGRDFVAGIALLDAEARVAGVFVTSGASSLPALSSAVVDRYASRFGKLQSVRHGIASGARAPGIATMRGVFSYCGKPFNRLENGHWGPTHGWQDMICHRFPSPVGRRLLGSCDVPDLILFPARYPDVQTVTFQAGFASPAGHLFVWAASHLVRFHLMHSLLPLVAPLHRISRWLESFVSDKGAMFVSMAGTDTKGQPLDLHWYLIATRNHGPHIPCGASIALARKLANGEQLPSGAMPCMGLLSVDEYLNALDGFDVREVPA